MLGADQLLPGAGTGAGSPANRDYRAGFTAAMMAKDLRLAQDAAQSVDVATPLGAQARQLYALFTNQRPRQAGLLRDH